MKTETHNKDFECRLALKLRLNLTRKWPIEDQIRDVLAN